MSSHQTPQDLMRASYQGIDPGNGETIKVDRGFFYLAINTAAAETRTLPVPDKAGLEIVLALRVDGGDCVVTVTSGYIAAGTTDLTFGDAGDWVRLHSIETAANTYRWRVVAQEGVIA